MSSEVIGAPESGSPAGISPLRPFAGLALAMSTSIGALAVGLGMGIRGPDLTLLALALAQLVVGFLPLIADSGRPPEQRRVLLSMIGIVYSIAFTLPVFHYYIPVPAPIDPPGMSNMGLTERHIAHAQALGLVGLLLIYAGYALPVRRMVQQLLPPPRYEWTELGTLTAAGVMTAFGGAFFLSGMLGVLPPMLGSGVLGGLMDLALIVPALLTLAFLRYRSKTCLILLLVFVPMISGFNLLSSSKRLTLLPWAMIALAYIIYTRKVQLRWMVAGFAALILIYPAAMFHREVVLQGRSTVEALTNPGATLRRVTGYVGSYSFSGYFDEGLQRAASRFDAVGHPAVIIRDTPAKVPFQNGRTIALVALAYVPRIIWPSKPTIGIGIWLNDNYNNSEIMVQSHLGPSWIGEFYLNFGTPGVLIGMVCLGALFRLWHEILAGRQRTIPLMLAEVVVLKDVIFHMTGGLVSVVDGPVNGVAPLVAIHLFVRFFGGVRPVAAAADESG